MGINPSPTPEKRGEQGSRRTGESRGNGIELRRSVVRDCTFLLRRIDSVALARQEMAYPCPDDNTAPASEPGAPATGHAGMTTHACRQRQPDDKVPNIIQPERLKDNNPMKGCLPPDGIMSG